MPKYNIIVHVESGKEYVLEADSAEQAITKIKGGEVEPTNILRDYLEIMVKDIGQVK